MKKILVLSFFTQIYVSMIGFLLMPVYLHYLGAEAFGLVGFYIMLQAWMQVLDMGLTPTLSREISRFQAGIVSVLDMWQKIRIVEWIFFSVCLLILVAFFLLSGWIADGWLKADSLSKSDISWCIKLMASALVLRWWSGLYRGILVGLELQKSVNWILIGVATVRFVGVIPLLALLGGKFYVFFGYQVIVALFEFLVSRLAAYSSLPRAVVSFFGDISSIRPMLPLAMLLTFQLLINLAANQLDKLILSSQLSLKAYGYFSLAVMAAGGVMILVPALIQVLQPRFTILAEKHDQKKLVSLFHLTSQFVTVAFVTLGGTIAFLSEPLLFFWTGNKVLSQAAAPIMFWYGLYNAIVGILTPPYMLQFAVGNLRFHVFGSFIFSLLTAPCVIWAAKVAGGEGTGMIVLAIGIIYGVSWVPYVINRIVSDIWWHWLFRDSLIGALLILGSFFALSHFVPDKIEHFYLLVWVLIYFLLGVFLGSVIYPDVRKTMLAFLK